MGRSMNKITDQEFIDLGFREDSEFKGLWYFNGGGFPFDVSQDDSGHLRLGYNLEYNLSSGRIPATVDNLKILLRAFCVSED